MRLVCVVVALCLLCTAAAARSNLKGDPDLASPRENSLPRRGDPGDSARDPGRDLGDPGRDPDDLDWNNHHHDLDSDLDPLDELDKHVQRMVKHLDVSTP